MGVVAMTPTETMEFLRAARGHSPRAHAMCLVSLRHGLRCSETTDLRLDQLNLKERWIRVERLKGSMTTVQPLSTHPGQPLLDEVAVLKRWLRERPNDGSDAVFTSQKGGRMNRSTFFRLWQEIARRAGLPAEKQHPHVAKHTAGSLLAEHGASMSAIQTALGHRSIRSSAVYASMSEQRAAEVARVAWMATF